MKKFDGSENLYCYLEEGEKAYRAVLTPMQILKLLDRGVERICIYHDNASYRVMDAWKEKDGKYYFDVKLEELKWLKKNC